MDDVERDEYLMARVADNRPEFLEPLVRRHANSLLTFLTRMVGNGHLGEELFQEVFLAIWLKRRQYQYPRPFKPWLYAIALNKCRSSFRTRVLATVPISEESVAVASSLKLSASGEDAPDDRMIAGETAEQVVRAVASLPSQQRAVVVLRIWEELSYARIAQLVDCTEATVRSHMHHGLASLRKLLSPSSGPSAKVENSSLHEKDKSPQIRSSLPPSSGLVPETDPSEHRP